MSEGSGWPVGMMADRTASVEEASPLSTSALMANALNFHGQQLTKIMEDKQVKLMGSVNIRTIDYHIYQQRTRELSTQDRSKRLKLLNFIADRAEQLFAPVTKEEILETDPNQTLADDEDLYAKVPTLPEFLSLTRSDYREQALKIVKPGHVVLCNVLGVKPTGSLVLDCVVNVSCSNMPVSGCRIRAVVPGHSVVDEAGHTWKTHELCMCLVSEVQQGDMLVMTLNEADLPPALVGRVKLGHRTVSDLSAPLRRALSSQEPQSSYEDHLHAATGFQNPNASLYLAEKYGVLNSKHSMGLHLRSGFPESECASGLRKEQQCRLALRSVAKGVALFKKGDYSEAFQCLNQALNVDPLNVEGLVARGALYANRGNFERAILDFEKALNEDSEHANAKKYMGETLVAQAKAYEDEKDYDKALDVYKLSLTFVPENKEALSSIRFLKAMKVGHLQEQDLIKLDDLAIPQRSEKSSELKKKLLALLDEDEAGSSSKKKKKRRRHSSSHSSSNSGSCSRSRSSASSKRSRDRSRSFKRSRSRNRSSLSPLSKKMQLMRDAQPPPVAGGPHDPALNAFNNPAPMQPVTEPVPVGANPYQMYPPGGAMMGQCMAPPHMMPPHMMQPGMPMTQTKSDEDQAYDEKVRRFLDSLEKDSARKSGPPMRERDHRGGPHDFRDHWEPRERLPRDSRDSRERDSGREPLPKSPEPYVERSQARHRDSDGVRARPREREPARGGRHRMRSDRDTRDRDREPRDARDRDARPRNASPVPAPQTSRADAKGRDLAKDKEEDRKPGKDRRDSGKSKKEEVVPRKEKKKQKEKDHERDEREKVKVKKKDKKVVKNTDWEKDDDEEKPKKKDKKKSKEEKKSDDKARSPVADRRDSRGERSSSRRERAVSDSPLSSRDGDEPVPPGEEVKSAPHLPATRPPASAPPKDRQPPEPEQVPTLPQMDDEFLYGDDLIDTDALGKEDEDEEDGERTPGKGGRSSSAADDSDKRNGTAPPEGNRFLSEIEQLRKQVAKLKEKQEKKKKRKKEKKDKKKEANRRSSSRSSRSRSPEERERKAGKDAAATQKKQQRPISSERTVRMGASSSSTTAATALQPDSKPQQTWNDGGVEVQKSSDGSVRIVKTETHEEPDSVAKMKAIFEEYQASVKPDAGRGRGRGGMQAGMKICLGQQKPEPPEPPKPLTGQQKAEQVRQKLDAALKGINPAVQPPVLRMDMILETKKMKPPAEAAVNVVTDVSKIPVPAMAGMPGQPMRPFDGDRVSTLRCFSPSPRSRSRDRTRRRSRSRSGSRRRRRSRSRSRGRRSRSISRGRRSRSRSRGRRSRSRSLGRRSHSTSPVRRRMNRSRSPIWPVGGGFRGRGRYFPGRYAGHSRPGRGRFPGRGRPWGHNHPRGQNKVEVMNRGRSDKFHWQRSRSRSRSSSRSLSRSRTRSRTRSRSREPPVPGEDTGAAPTDVNKLMHGKWVEEGKDEEKTQSESLEETEKMIAEKKAEKMKDMLERNKHLLREDK